jgi:hypothetical protein
MCGNGSPRGGGWHGKPSGGLSTKHLMLLKLPGDGYSLLCSKKQPPRHNDCKLQNEKKFIQSGGGQFFLKTFCASLFNDDLSNEPNFGQIPLAGKYL